MPRKCSTLNEYIVAFQREAIERFIGSDDGKKGFPVATQSPTQFASDVLGKVKLIEGVSEKDAVLVIPSAADEVPKVLVAAHITNYRKILQKALAQEEIVSADSSEWDGIDADHTLSTKCARGVFRIL